MRKDVPLSGGLEEEPLEEVELLALVDDAELALLVVALGEVIDDRGGLPDHEVAIAVVDERRDAPVGVVLCVLRCLLLALAEVEIDGLVGEAELLEHERDFPVREG